MSAIETAATAHRERSTAGAYRPSRVWWWVIVAFVVQLAAWTAWFVIAARSPVAEVPLVTESVR